MFVRTHFLLSIVNWWQKLITSGSKKCTECSRSLPRTPLGGTCWSVTESLFSTPGAAADWTLDLDQLTISARPVWPATLPEAWTSSGSVLLNTFCCPTLLGHRSAAHTSQNHSISPEGSLTPSRLRNWAQLSVCSVYFLSARLLSLESTEEYPGPGGNLISVFLISCHCHGDLSVKPTRCLGVLLRSDNRPGHSWLVTFFGELRVLLKLSLTRVLLELSSSAIYCEPKTCIWSFLAA